jgi:hypothetical protein
LHFLDEKSSTCTGICEASYYNSLSRSKIYVSVFAYGNRWVLLDRNYIWERIMSWADMQELMETYKNQGKLHRRFAFQILLDILHYFSNQPTLVDVTIPQGAP